MFLFAFALFIFSQKKLKK